MTVDELARPRRRWLLRARASWPPTAPPLPQVLTGQGIICGIKVDTGTTGLAGFPGEKITRGLDGLAGRLQQYRELGARFTKWRAVITIAAASQEAELVPIVEPEVLMDGDHPIERCDGATRDTLAEVFAALRRHRVQLDGILLKPTIGAELLLRAGPAGPGPQGLEGPGGQRPSGPAGLLAPGPAQRGPPAPAAPPRRWRAHDGVSGLSQVWCGGSVRPVGGCHRPADGGWAARLPRTYLGRRLGFADGTTSFVFRETAVRDRDPRDPAVLVVQFRLRAFGHRRWLHAVFRRECILHTPLFAGFPGFQSKLWISDTATGTYRGLYEWDGAERAVDYAEHLVRLLIPLSTGGSVRYHVIPGSRRQDLLGASGSAAAAPERGADGWWRLTEPLEEEPAQSG